MPTKLNVYQVLAYLDRRLTFHVPRVIFDRIKAKETFIPFPDDPIRFGFWIKRAAGAEFTCDEPKQRQGVRCHISD